MRVIATQKGYYGNVVREPGDVFTLADEAAFSGVWMQAIEAGGDEPVKPKARKGQVRETEVIPPADPAPALDPVTGDEI